MREQGRKPDLGGSIGPGGTPQCQHSIETQAIDRLRYAGLLDLPVRDYKLAPRFGDLTFLRTAAFITLDALGLSAIARQVEQAGVAQAVDRLGLDGMLALWHPAGAN